MPNTPATPTPQTAATAASTTPAATTAAAAAAPTITFPQPGASSSITVTAPATPGTLTFQLIVTDDLGQTSAPATATVVVQGAPTAVLTATPAAVKPGGTITLNGASSTAMAPGKLTTYAFSLKPAAG